MLTPQIKKTLERNYKNIGTLPTIISSLMRVLGDQRSSAKDLAKVIAADQVLSMRLLNMVNSAYYGLREKVIDVQQAVNLVGFNVIRSFTFCITLFDSLFSSSEGVQFDKMKFWAHSLGVGAAAREIANRQNIGNANDIFVAGLVHDIGKVFMIQFLPNDFFKALENSIKNKESLYEAEKALLDTTHAEIGSFMMEKWNLPALLQKCARFHHESEIVKDGATQVELIALSDNLAKEMQIGYSGDDILMPEYSRLKAKYHITPELIREIMHPLQEEVALYAEIMKDKSPEA
jgi:HD-like signal output (HDOD) protein